MYILPDSEQLSNQKLWKPDIFRKKTRVFPQGLNHSTLSKQSSIIIPVVFWVTIGLFNFLHHGKVIPGDPIIYLPSIWQMVMNKSAFICNEIRHNQELCNHNTESKTRKKKEQAFFILWLYLLGFGTSNKDRVLKIEICLNNRDVRFSSLT